ncbi:uncharacterized protein BO97DRAFT_466093 [Aspergillus homomorphus CBS 101889]|uniref:Uncharacterized protein n=1 Tax=Aspergillus homomorphus (strain CBS 101889) TaxID=1450537 RepID=A0A395I861_ASPHC|nr:hypothetical protein BO97DRAFT_466093 [Aspergillus homomorphus CBS 101889]RAL14354.1 hypothetical protein BO97DRAFT_466093 [Aspergillus homomorphus CBS 101889]
MSFRIPPTPRLAEYARRPAYDIRWYNIGPSAHFTVIVWNNASMVDMDDEPARALDAEFRRQRAENPGSQPLHGAVWCGNRIRLYRELMSWAIGEDRPVRHTIVVPASRRLFLDQPEDAGLFRDWYRTIPPNVEHADVARFLREYPVSAPQRGGSGGRNASRPNEHYTNGNGDYFPAEQNGSYDRYFL